MTTFTKLVCAVIGHKWRTTRILKPHLWSQFGHFLGADHVCDRCGREYDWRTVERDVWESPMAGQNEHHPNHVCPCRLCIRFRANEVTP
jgi:hypothetical protein